jgi:hypothetical protein
VQNNLLQGTECPQESDKLFMFVTIFTSHLIKLLWFASHWFFSVVGFLFSTRTKLIWWKFDLPAERELHFLCFSLKQGKAISIGFRLGPQLALAFSARYLDLIKMKLRGRKFSCDIKGNSMMLGTFWNKEKEN